MSGIPAREGRLFTTTTTTTTRRDLAAVRSNRNNKALGAVEGRVIKGGGGMLVGVEEGVWRREMGTSTILGLTEATTIPFSFCQSDDAVSLCISTCLTICADSCRGALYDMVLNDQPADTCRNDKPSHLPKPAADTRTSNCQYLQSQYALNKHLAAHAHPTQKQRPRQRVEQSATMIQYLWNDRQGSDAKRRRSRGSEPFNRKRNGCTYTN